MKHVIIQLWQTSAEHPQHAATPFMIAVAAAAMDMDVEIHALGASVELFVDANTARHPPVAPLNRSLSEYVDDALRMGVRLYACSTAMRDRQLESVHMIQGFTEIIGMVSMLERATQSDVTVLTY